MVYFIARVLLRRIFSIHRLAFFSLHASIRQDLAPMCSLDVVPITHQIILLTGGRTAALPILEGSCYGELIGEGK